MLCSQDRSSLGRDARDFSLVRRRSNAAFSSLYFLQDNSRTKRTIRDLEFFSDAADGAHRGRLLAVIRLQHFSVWSVPPTGRLQSDRRSGRSEDLADQTGGSLTASRIAHDLSESAVSERRATVVTQLFARGILAGVPDEPLLRTKKPPERPVLSHQPRTIRQAAGQEGEEPRSLGHPSGIQVDLYARKLYRVLFT